MKNLIQFAGKKVILLFLLIMGLAVSGFSQCPGQVDLEATTIDPGSAAIAVGEVTQIFVSMTNNGPCPIPATEATLQITLSSVAFDLGVPFSFSDLCAPQWSYLGAVSNATQHNLFFQNNAGPIPVGASCQFQFDIRGKNLAPNSPITLASSLSGTASSSDINPTNQSVSTQLTVVGVLPLKLRSFTGQSNQCSNTLSWISTDEKNVQTIEVQSSEDGANFKKIGAVAARNSNGEQRYSFVDEANLAKVFYRLKIIDIDGNTIYSSVLKLNTACKQPSASVFPNPVNASTNANVVLKNFTGKITGQLQDMSGKQLATIKLLNGTNAVNLSSYAQGTYILKVVDETQATQTLKIITFK